VAPLLERSLCAILVFPLAQSLKGTVIKISVVETQLFCVEFSTLSFVTSEIEAFPVWLTILHSLW